MTGAEAPLENEGAVFRPCVLIPIFDNPTTIGPVVESLAPLGLPCFIVDDGSGAETRAVLSNLADDLPWVKVQQSEVNEGKGAALVAGFRWAHERGHTHAIQVDADGQHETADIPRFLEAAKDSPRALVLGRPLFDDSAPAARRYGRLLTNSLIWLETLSFDITDGLCGFRCYPLEEVVELLDRHSIERRMGFDADIAVRLHWQGAPIRNLDTFVRYPPGGVSHFRYVRDNLHLTRTHTMLVLGMLRRLPQRRTALSERARRRSEITTGRC